ncbi:MULTISPECIES: GyrI-like domain-containing protein [Microbacterium]|uniref:GyrI-like domain-containing protein n=1 Tax=Microbacterium TaxID=33882 RepID=UPI00217D1D63|nr:MULTISPECIES: GyrI-like domain-containing protein [Microbacterium]UWF76711.1 GyrI-like domain-containing protein [Microbacterium neungamense]WCM54861.1 GyrI-like domain-containing protein [Microbacterium sp. EF45047]
MTALPAGPFGPADRIDLTATPLAVVRRAGLRVDDLTEAFDAGYGALGRLIADGRVVPAGPAMAIYRGDPMGVFDLEIGFPLRTPLADAVDAGGAETVHPSELPQGPAFATTAVGPYDQLGSAWGALVQRAADQGAAPAGIWIESYVSDPSDTPADRLRTDLIMPLRP